ncbi:T3SS effector HopA1 family protein [Corynebacterium liangguodongii]|uniref:T3SS effector HopA1 family protein n=1 Tax=Corynebacterium liangguodongii TaxID=2079535 RepID=UPI0011B20A29|nr:T3SS effector HopA1 family protein [Corynebacterium liangguodongii]
MLTSDAISIYRRWHVRNRSLPTEINPWLIDHDLLNILRRSADTLEPGHHTVYGVNTAVSEKESIVFSNLSPGFHAATLDRRLLSVDKRGLPIVRIYIGFSSKKAMLAEASSIIEMIRAHTSLAEVKCLVGESAFPRTDALTAYLYGSISRPEKLALALAKCGDMGQASAFCLPLGSSASAILETPEMGRASGLSYGLYASQIVSSEAKSLGVEPNDLVHWLASDNNYWLPPLVRERGDSFQDWAALLASFQYGDVS